MKINQDEKYIAEETPHILLSLFINSSMSIFTISFAIFTWDITNKTALTFSPLYILAIIMFLCGLFLGLCAIIAITKLFKRPYIILSPKGIRGNILKEPIEWENVANLGVIEKPEWYFSLIKIFILMSAKPGRLGMCHDIADDLDDENLKKTFNIVYIKDKNGNKNIIRLDQSLIKTSIYEAIKEYYTNYRTEAKI